MVERARANQGTAAHPSEGALIERYATVRAQTFALCEGLETEDFVPQSAPECSPLAWHLAHTAWFFEAVVLARHDPAHRPLRELFSSVYTSCCDDAGEWPPRGERGVLTRPTVGEVFDYRRRVDERVAALLGSASPSLLRELWPVIELGLNHEQQHQELMLTDLKHLFSRSPLKPAYRTGELPACRGSEMGWLEFAEGVRWIGAEEGARFSFGNESPRHRVFLDAFEIADRLVTNGEYLVFVEEGGYDRPELWLEEGWEAVRREGWRGPLYWRRDGDRRLEFTLWGERELDPHAAASHLSFFEAEAYARWAGARLPTEAEWEFAAAEGAGDAAGGNLLERGRMHPGDALGAPGGRLRRVGSTMRQAFGDVWEWVRSDYGPYPGYRAATGAGMGESNGRSMCGRYVLRGGSCATPASHIRATYRHSLPPGARWQFSGVRLARAAGGAGRRSDKQ